MVGAAGRDVITVKVAGDIKGVGEFTPVKVTELVATTWAMGDRAGVSFRAAYTLARSMDDISVQHVVTAAEKLLAGSDPNCV